MMLVLRSNHDIQTSYLYTNSAELIDEAKNRNLPVAIIENKELTKETIRSRIHKTKPKFIFFNGHGSKAALFNNEIRGCDPL